MQPLIAIPANDIDASGMAVDVVLPAAWITARLGDEQYHAEGDGRFNGRLSRSGKADIVVRGAIEATVVMPCARCLRPSKTEVHGDVVLLLKPRSTSDHARPPREDRSRSRQAEYEFTSEEADQDEYDGETVVLDPFVRDAILLELPNFPLCSESCPGISRGPNNWPDVRPAPLARANPFEALKHLRPSLAEGEPLDETTAKMTAPANGGMELGRAMDVGRGIELGRRSTTKKNETKIASTHAAPRRRPSAKASSKAARARAGKRGKRP